MSYQNARTNTCAVVPRLNSTLFSFGMCKTDSDSAKHRQCAFVHRRTNRHLLYIGIYVTTRLAQEAPPTVRLTAI